MRSSHAELLMRFQLTLIVFIFINYGIINYGISIIELNTDKLSQKIIYGHVLSCDFTAAKWALKCDYSIGMIHNPISLKPLSCQVKNRRFGK